MAMDDSGAASVGAWWESLDPEKVERIVLPPEAWDAFVETLNGEPRVVPELIRLFKRSQRIRVAADDPATVQDAERYSAYLQTRCLSMWEGCCCHEPDEHEGLHQCPACGETWTTEQAEEWVSRIQRDH